MAKLVQKSGYIKSGKASGYMRYIATREGVEKLAGNGSVTKGQRELIQKLLTDFPDAVELFEYEDYCKTPTLGTASAFITMALDANLHGIDSESGYMQYIATRPRVQKHGGHGLICGVQGGPGKPFRFMVRRQFLHQQLELVLSLYRRGSQ